MNKEIRIIAEIAILSALGLVFDFIGGAFFSFAWLNGGSVSLAMLPIIICSYRHGLKKGLLCGFLVGTIQLMWAKYYGLVSTFLDYIIAYTFVGLAGIFNIQHIKGRKRTLYLVLGLFTAFISRLACHVISGVVEFKAPLLFSITYNISFLGISILLCGFVLYFLSVGAPQLIFTEQKTN